jgi:hypothetical protein
MTLKAVVSRYSEVSRILRHFSGYCFVRPGFCITARAGSHFTFGLNRSGSARATRIFTGLHRLPHPMHKNNSHSLCFIRSHELLPDLLPQMKLSCRWQVTLFTAEWELAPKSWTLFRNNLAFLVQSCFKGNKIPVPGRETAIHKKRHYQWRTQFEWCRS